MIAFATVFLGLMLGAQSITVMVGDDVASVDFVVDGEPVARLDSEPWTVGLDFGDELVPRELVAIARDAQGLELARVNQWLNLPQPPAELSVVLEEPRPDGSRGARLTWESQAGREPLAVQASFDGTPLTVTDPRRLELPPHDNAALHFLRVEMDFGDQVTALHEMTLGGTFVDETSGEMTAVLVRSKKKSLEVGDLAGKLTLLGKPLEVLAVEQGPAEIVLVTDLAYRDGMKPIVREVSRELGLSVTNAQSLLRLRTAMRYEWALGRDDQVRVLWPVSEAREGVESSYELFPATQSFSFADGGLFWILTGLQTAADLQGEQRLADAVATAGMSASARRRRRAVVLLASQEPDETSSLSTGQAQRYLQRLQVPLHVWQMAPRRAEIGWPTDHPLNSKARLLGSLRELRNDLDQQWIVWVEGIHLPQRIELSADTKGVELVR